MLCNVVQHIKCHVMSCKVMKYHVMSCHNVMSCNVMQCHVMYVCRCVRVSHVCVHVCTRFLPRMIPMSSSFFGGVQPINHFRFDVLEG